MQTEDNQNTEHVDISPVTGPYAEPWSLIVKPTINFTLARLGNLASERVYSRNCCSLKCKHIFGFYYKKIIALASVFGPAVIVASVRQWC